jgi:1-acyl-sn-glycerol-3-phosphate acyltransferase
VNGTESVKNARKKPYIIVLNHPSMADPFLLAVLPLSVLLHLIPFYSLTTEHYYKIPWLQPFIRLFGGYPLRLRSWSLEEYFGESLKRLSKRKNILVFPEGKLIQRGNVIAARPGIAYLALKSEVPLLPVLFEGVEGMGLRSFLLRKHRLIVNCGEPFFIQRSPEQHPDRRFYKEKAAEIMQRVYSL